MQAALVKVALDAGAREISSLLSAVLAAGLVVVLVVVFLPVVLVASLMGAPGTDRTAPTVPMQQSAAAMLAPATAPATLPATAPGSTAPPLAPPAQASSRIVELARQYLGVPYVFGGTDPRYGLDCSGLVQLVYREAGINLPRTAQLQFNATARVSRDELQPGDLVFFARTYDDPHDWITHVGIYIGDGMQINAPTEGQVVSIQPVFTGFWGSHFAGGGRA